MATFVTPADVRAYLNVTSNTGQYSDGLIGSNINAASGNLQTWTGRQFESQGGSNTAYTKTFSSDGQATIVLPGLISAAAITSQSVPLIANQTYWLIPDNLQTGVYTGLQVHSYGWQDYRANPEWFDRNLDSWLYRGKVGAGNQTLPNDVSVAGWWGHVPLPSPLLHATVLLAGYYTLRPDSLLTGVVQVGEGAFSSLSGIPDEVREFVHTWSLRSSVVAV